MTTHPSMTHFEQFFNQAKLPNACIHGCDSTSILWNGSALRTVTVREDDRCRTHSFRLRRVKCKGCSQSWRLLPPGVVRYRRFQLCVVAEVVTSYVLGERTMQAVADANAMARRTVSRLVRWVGELATPGQLLARLVELTDSTSVPEPPRSRQVAHRLTHQVRNRVAESLGLMEAIGVAVGLEPPALRAIVERLGVTTYRRPAIPELALCGLLGRLSIFAM